MMYGQNQVGRDLENFMPQKEFLPGLIDFKDPLELKDQHLVSLANSNGYLAGRVTELEKANFQLDSRNRKLEDENAELRTRNEILERKQTEAQAGYKSGAQLVSEIELALACRLETKE